MTKKIVIYGKGGIGKSIICQNLAAAVAEMGYKVMIIGCDPKCDSTLLITHGKKINTVLDIIQQKKEITPEDFLNKGYKDIVCIEAGGPPPGVGCSGRGIILALQTLEKSNLFNDIDFVIFDVPGDVVCGGFAVPIRKGYSDEVYIVTSGEYLSLLAANNICKGLQNNKANLAGVIANSRSPMKNSSVVSKFAEKIGSEVIAELPYSEIIKKCEKQLKTVFETNSKHKIIITFKKLAKRILENQICNIPNFLNEEELKKLFYENRLYKRKHFKILK